jgi:hypothetical protein
MIVYQTDNQGFYLGPVQADESPLEAGVFLIPAGCVEEEPPTFSGNERPRWEGGRWVLETIPEPQPITLPLNQLVNVERDRRVLEGSTFQITGYGTVRIRGDETTTRNLQGLAFGAQLRMAQGDLSSLTPFRDEDNVVHMLTPMQVIELWSKGAAFISACFQAAWDLKDGPEGIPEDYQEDRYWP